MSLDSDWKIPELSTLPVCTSYVILMSGFYYHQLHLKLLSPYTACFLCSISSCRMLFPCLLFPCITLHSTPCFCCFYDPSSVSLLPEFSFSAHTAHIGIPTVMSLAISLNLLAHSQWFHHPCRFNQGFVFGWVPTLFGEYKSYTSLLATDPYAWHPCVLSSLDIPKEFRLGDVPQSKLAHPFFYPPTCSSSFIPHLLECSTLSYPPKAKMRASSLNLPPYSRSCKSQGTSTWILFCPFPSFLTNNLLPYSIWGAGFLQVS